MNAAVRGRGADGSLVAGAVDIDQPRVGIHVAALIEAGFKPREPEDAGGDFGVGQVRLRGVADYAAAFEDGARRFAAADFFRDAMQAERRAIRAGGLAAAEARGGAGKSLDEPVLLE